MKIEHVDKNGDFIPQTPEFPLMCVIGLSYICNSRCPSCPYTNSDIRNSYKDVPFMGRDTFKIIADQCGPHKAWIRISGAGEPMLHPEAVSLIEYAKKKEAKVGLITNGSRFSEEDTHRLLAAGIDMIEFSVDAADAKTYAQVRTGLDWDNLLANVKRFVHLRNKTRSQAKIIASGINQVGVDIEKVAVFWSKIVDDFQKRKYLTWGINDPGKSADPVPYLPPEKHIPCPFIFERLNIDSRGKGIICGFDILARSDLGNVHEKSIAEIWYCKELKYFRDKHLQHKGHEIELCSQCTDWKYRSWKHNYWKIVKKAEVRRKSRFAGLDSQDTEGNIAED